MRRYIQSFISLLWVQSILSVLAYFVLQKLGFESIIYNFVLQVSMIFGVFAVLFKIILNKEVSYTSEWIYFAIILLSSFQQQWLIGSLVTIVVSLRLFLVQRLSLKYDKKVAHTRSLIPTSSHFKKGLITYDYPVQEIKVGDILVVNEHEIIPVQCRIVSGISQVSDGLYKDKIININTKTGDILQAGLVNKSGRLEVVALKNYEEDVLYATVSALVNIPNQKIFTLKRFNSYLTIIDVVLVLLSLVFLIGESYDKALSILLISQAYRVSELVQNILYIISLHVVRYGYVIANVNLIPVFSKIKNIIIDEQATFNHVQLTNELVVTNFKKRSIIEELLQVIQTLQEPLSFNLQLLASTPFSKKKTVKVEVTSISQKSILFTTVKNTYEIHLLTHDNEINSTLKGDKKIELDQKREGNLVFLIKENQIIIGYIVVPFVKDAVLNASIEYLNTDYKVAMVGDRKLAWLNETAHRYNLLNSYEIDSKSLDGVCSDEAVELRKPVLVVTQDNKYVRSNRRPITLTTNPYINGTKSDLFRIKPQFSYLDQFILLLKSKANELRRVYMIGILLVVVQSLLVAFSVPAELVLVSVIVSLFGLYFLSKRVVRDIV
jgi:hypothetical protein